MLSLWAHSGQTSVHEHGPGGLPLWAIVGIAVVLLAVVLGWGVWADRRFRTRVARARRSRVAGHESWIKRQRVLQASTAFVIVLAAAVAIPLRPEPELVLPPTPVAFSTPQAGEDFPITFLEARSDGTIRVRIGNESKSGGFVQCLIDALDDSGQSVLTGTYDAIEPDGKEYQSETYAATVALEAGTKTTVGVNMRVAGPVARFDGSCGPVPRIPDGRPG